MSFTNLPLSYCTNVHPGRNVDEVIDGLNQYTAAVRRSVNLPIAAGLWLSNSTVTELLESESQLDRLGQALWQNDLSCHTLNAFPYGDFHSDRVKEQVYLPDWASNERMKYTQDCARILAKLLPENSEGSISTLPLGGTMNATEPDFHAKCFKNLIRCARFLKDLHKETGRLIRLAVEPEPLCHISSIRGDAVPQFRALYEMADALGNEAETREHVGLCLDVCHQAVEFETLPVSIDQLNDEGIRINKVHITNAVEIKEPAKNKDALEALKAFVEPRYLHQVYAKMANGSIEKRLDLTEELLSDTSDTLFAADVWRVHFHVPIFAETIGNLTTTRPDLQAALTRIARLPYAPHLEVETYTWPVMPDATDSSNGDLVAQITGELQSTFEILLAASKAST